MEATEQRRRPDMEAFFEAKSVAVMGASPESYKPNGRAINALMKQGYRGKIYPVNPKYEEIAGLKCYPSVLHIPGEVDLVVMGVAASAVPDLARQCAQKGVKGMVILTSGFAEMGEEGQKVEQELSRLCRESGMRIMGPNCMGMVNNLNKLWASFAELAARDENFYYPHRFSLISQSGFFGSMICSLLGMQGVGFNHFASVGNQADLSFTDFFEYIVDEPRAKIITGYIEGLKQGGLFMEVAREAYRQKKPVIVMKAGQTEAGARAVSSHTGSLAGSDRIYDAAFRQCGVIRAHDLSQLVAGITFAASGRFPAGNRVALVTSIKDYGVVLADQCCLEGLHVPELHPETVRRLKSLVPLTGSPQNPVNLTQQLMNDPEAIFNGLHLVAADPNVDLIILSIELDGEIADKAADGFVKLYRETGKPVMVIRPPVSDPAMRKLRRRICTAGYSMYRDMEPAIWAAGAVTRWSCRAPQAFEKPPLSVPGKEREQAMAAIAACNSRHLTEYRAGEILRAYGISTPRGILVLSADEAVEAAEAMGYPVVLKVQSPDILHKTDAGGLAVNLASAGEVRDAYARILSSAASYSTHARIEGILVQEMLPPGIESIIGVKHDDTFGPVLMFGLGGIFVEAFEDVSFRVAPITRTDAREMIREIRGYRAFEGLRGAPPADLEALEGMLLKISRLAAELSGVIEEMDMNPLFVFPRGRGVAVADALITLKNEQFL